MIFNGFICEQKVLAHPQFDLLCVAALLGSIELSTSCPMARQTHKLAEVCKEALREARLQLIRQNPTRPIMQSDSCDGTPMNVSVQVAAQLHDTVIRRKGKSSHEFLVASEFVRVKNIVGETSTCMVLMESS